MKQSTKTAIKHFCYFFLMIIVATFIYTFIKMWLQRQGLYTDGVRFLIIAAYGITLFASYRYLSKRIDQVAHQSPSDKQDE